MFGMKGVFAEFERSMIVARVNAAMARAKASGTKNGKAIGRPRISKDDEQRIRDRLADGAGILKVASELGFATATVHRIKRAWRLRSEEGCRGGRTTADGGLRCSRPADRRSMPRVLDMLWE